MVDFVPLHVHSSFSLLDGFGTPEMIINRAEELGLKAIALTEHGNTSSHVWLEKEAKNSDVKPIYGVELYMVEDINENRQKKNHLTVLAKDKAGYQNLLKLASIAHRDDHFYYMPTVDLQDVFEHQEGLIILSGCLSGILSKMVLEEEEYNTIKTMANTMNAGIEHFYLEIQPLDLEDSQKVNEVLIKVAEDTGIPLVATNDVHYVNKGEQNVQHFLSMVKRRTNVKKDKWGEMSERCYIPDGETMIEWGAPEVSVTNTAKIAEMVEEFELPRAKAVKYPDTDNAKETILEWCREGWVKRDIPRDKWDEYKERLFYEIDIIEQKDFLDYFLVVGDMVRWAKSDEPLPSEKHNAPIEVKCTGCGSWLNAEKAYDGEYEGNTIYKCTDCEHAFTEFEIGDDSYRKSIPTKVPILVGPARGSAAGSLLSYLLGITEVDPIEWDLLFERFMDVERYDPPDIDLDFQDDRRGEVKEYLEDRYGREKVANIAGYSMFKNLSLLDDFGRCYNIPKWKIKEVKEEAVDNGGDKTAEEILEEYWPEYSYVAKALGTVRHLTVHAAGVIVSTEPISNITTIGRDGIMLDKRDAADLGLLKIDVLGLTQLNIISKILDKLGKDTEWLYSLPLDDEKTLEAFSKDEFMGIFQFEGNTTKGVCQQVEPEGFDTLIDINALSRPGPLSSGATDAYIKGNRDDIHPVVTKWTDRSRGQILFQEQIMRILREAGNLSWSDVNAVRKLITKNKGEEKLEGIKDRFMEAFEDNPELGEEIWHRCGESGAYGFNISHSTSYTFLGYYTMYLKVHYPLEFYWANMAVRPDNERMLREYMQKGGKVYPVKYPKSGKGWTIDNGGLRAGYMTLHGIGPKTAEKLMDGNVTGRAKTILEEADAFEDEGGSVDYLGLDALQEELAKIEDRTKIENIIPDEFVRIAGRITKMKIKNLREVVESQGKNYEAEVSSPEFETYINMMFADETGETMCTINRFKCADPILWEKVVEDHEEEDIYVIIGQHSSEYQKVYVNKIFKLEEMGMEAWKA
jgi:DNA polymerase-3 subunit alpha